MDDFIYNSNRLKIAEQNLKANDVLDYDINETDSDDKTEQKNILKNKTFRIIDALKKEDYQLLEKLKYELGIDKNRVAVRLIYFWQNNFDDRKLSGFISEIIADTSNEILKKWCQWFTAKNIPDVISGEAMNICKRKKISFGEFCFVYRILPDGKLGQKISDCLNKRSINIMNEEKMKKIIVRYRDNNYANSITYECSDGLTSVCIPTFESNPNLIFITESDKEYKTKLRTFEELVDNGIDGLSTDEVESLENFIDGKNFNHSFEITKTDDYAPPCIKIKDITETLLLGFPPLTEAVICGKNGIWSHHGKRIFEVEIQNLSIDDSVISTEMIFDKIDGREMWESHNCENFKRKKIKNAFYCVIDTDIIGEKLDALPEQRNKVSCEGAFTVKKLKNKNITETYEFKFSLTVCNTSFYDSKNKELCLNKHAAVSIDFGTSSTCAAIKSNITRLVEMSRDDFGKSAYNVYENPTMLRVYNWDAINEKWVSSSASHPVLRKNYVITDGRTRDDFSDFSDEVFDFGHNVKDTMKNDMATQESVITKLKMIPRDELDGVYNVFVPYSTDDIGKINLVCSHDEDDRNFDPIAYYCYLLGCAINHPNENENQFYTKYILTFPVKFDEKVRENLYNSIKKGLLRSLPSPVKDILDKGRNLISIEMKYSEPVACAGAICGHEINTSDDCKAKLFGIFDFGGGTIDFSFGMYRDADEETEDYSEAVEIFGTDGDESFGGELLIRKISYWILRQNQEVVASKRILFEMPGKDDPVPDGFSQLVQSSEEAKANIRKMNETFSRWYFEGNNEKFSALHSETATIEEIKISNPDFVFKVDGLYSTDGEVDEVEFVVNFDTIDALLKKEIDRICNVFKASMINTFSQDSVIKEINNFDCEFNARETGLTDTEVIISGNASKHPMVRECLKNMFSTVKLVGEKRNSINENKYKVTPKTAVAIGALNLSNMLVKLPEDFNNDSKVSNWYIAREIKGKKELLISRNSADTSWKRVGKINGCQVRIFYSGILDVETAEVWKSVTLDFDEDGDICYLRSAGPDKIEYIAVRSGTNLDDDAEGEITILK